MPQIPRGLSSETKSIMNSVRRLFQAIRVSSRNSEKTVGLTAAQLFVLQKLQETHGLSLNELAEATLTHQSSVSVVVTRLVNRGFIRRRRSKDDGRQLVLGVTPKGEALLKKAPKPVQDWLLIGIEKLETKGRKDLDRTLEKLTELCGIPSKQPAPMLFEGNGNGNGRKTTRKKITRKRTSNKA